VTIPVRTPFVKPKSEASFIFIHLWREKSDLRNITSRDGRRCRWRRPASACESFGESGSLPLCKVPPRRNIRIVRSRAWCPHDRPHRGSGRRHHYLQGPQESRARSRHPLRWAWLIRISTQGRGKCEVVHTPVIFFAKTCRSRDPRPVLAETKKIDPGDGRCERGSCRPEPYYSVLQIRSRHRRNTNHIIIIIILIIMPKASENFKTPTFGSGVDNQSDEVSLRIIYASIITYPLRTTDTTTMLDTILSRVLNVRVYKVMSAMKSPHVPPNAKSAPY